MKTRELRDLSIEELEQRHLDTLKEGFDLHIMKATGKIDNPLRIRSVRREIARIRTILKERK